MESISRMSVRELSARLAARELSAEEVLNAYLSRIEGAEPEVCAYLSVLPGLALEKAREIDARRAAGETLHPLAGVPAALKDNLCTSFGHTTCASKMLEGFEAPYDATAVRLLASAGAVFLG